MQELPVEIYSSILKEELPVEIHSSVYIEVLAVKICENFLHTGPGCLAPGLADTRAEDLNV